jgi:hypothetical protein
LPSTALTQGRHIKTDKINTTIISFDLIIIPPYMDIKIFVRKYIKIY